MLRSDMLWDLLHFLHRMHWRYSPTASPYSSNMVAACCCYALRSTQLSNILASLMLRSKICASFFQASNFYHHWMLRSKMFSSISKHHWRNWSSIFYYHWRYVRSKIFSSSFQHQRFYTQRSSPLFSMVFQHCWCYAFRSSLHFSDIINAAL